jgi:hypothetical protein
MANYDFLIFSPDEFERFCRDLLQEILKIKLESFTTGRDQGIDLRYSSSKKSIIIQCKRYSHFKDLYSNLKKELKKVTVLNPKRYILTTSVGLTPKNKEEIFKLFTGYIKDQSDIMGKDDLNNYLSSYPTVETKYYKLWLSSTNILKKILHSKVINQSEIEKQTINKHLELFVQNDSFDEAMEILKKYRFVLISGIPGIGKTTLGRFLVYYLIGSGMEEFIFLSDSINDAFTSWIPEKKQVFLFDDFLGKRNFMKSNLSTNEDRRILDFIDMIRESKNKYLVFTTREYILRQAQNELENINELGNEIKCIVDLQKYNKVSRGRILYNHLFFYGLPREYIQSILENSFYLKLIDHRNYSPRLIESITKKKMWENIDSKEYGEIVLSYFDDPNVLWEHAFENQISELSRCLLAILTTTDTPIFLSDLELAIQNFSKIHSSKYQKYTYFEFNNSIKELEDTFIRTNKDGGENIIIDFQNPSIHDFLCHYFDKNKTLLIDVISVAIFFNQLVVAFTSDKNDHTRIKLNKDIEVIIVNKILLEYEYLNLSLLSQYQSTKNGVYYRKMPNSDIIKIDFIANKLTISEYKKLKVFLREKLLLIDIEKMSGSKIGKYLRILELIKDEFLNNDIIRNILLKLFSAVETTDDLDYFSYAKQIDDDFFNQLVNETDSKSKIFDICEQELSDSLSSQLEDYRYTLTNIESNYLMNFGDLLNKIDERIDAYKERIEEYDASDDYKEKKEDYTKIENAVLKDMFDSLL